MPRARQAVCHMVHVYAMQDIVGSNTVCNRVLHLMCKGGPGQAASSQQQMEFDEHGGLVKFTVYISGSRFRTMLGQVDEV